jgi:4-amino-4-deoxy-L-arabinose transferase-like glycosyltransferase
VSPAIDREISVPPVSRPSLQPDASAPARAAPAQADEPEGLHHPSPARTGRRGLAHSRRALEWLALGAIVAGAAGLRLASLKGVAADPYYDAAVRSMGLSWHNFLFGALEPGATVSLDKPPLDLWPAVLSTKLFGFGTFAMRLPEALAGVAAVAFVYLAVRRPFGARAGFGAAAALAVLPIEVISSRSDTTDAIMMALTALALYLVVLAVSRERAAPLLWAAVALGVAFNVKLAESWLALPPLALIAILGMAPRARGRTLLAAAGVYVVVALSWLVLTLIVPAHDQPYAVGSTDGSPWNAAFVFNGVDRLRGSQQLEGTTGSFQSARHYPQATQAERDRVPITPPSATRLLVRVGPLSGERLGIEVLAALLLGLPALFAAWWPARRARAPGRQSDAEWPTRAQRALLAGLTLWLLEGIVLFSAIGRLHPRYTEAFVPAVAAMLGIGVAWTTDPSRATRGRLAALVVCVSAVCGYGAHLLYGTPAIWWVTLASGIAAIAMALIARVRGAAFVPLLCCLLAIPLWASLNAVREHVSDANVLGAVPSGELARLSAYLRAHQDGAHYETAYDAATKMGALVVRDARPVLALTTVEGHPVVSAPELARLAGEGRVRYAYLPSPCPPGGDATNADCSAAARWVRAHATDVSGEAGLRAGSLWRLPSAGAGG